MSRISYAFRLARDRGRPARIPFLMAGDPDPSVTIDLCRALERAGADIIEIGVPFSDPLADGPTIQRAAGRAIARGIDLAGALDLAAGARREVGSAIVLFTYYNPVLRMGEETFVRRAADAGLDGVLVTDLPLEEGGSLRAGLERNGLDPILLLAPTSNRDRIERTAAEARGFLYLISRTGVTGARGNLPDGLEEWIGRVREATALPLAVGFGISSPGQVSAIGRIADGVVVGSALVASVEAAVERGTPHSDLAGALQREAGNLFGPP